VLKSIRLAFLLALVSTSASAMDFSIERIDLRPIREPTLSITATGKIEPGDTGKLAQALASADTLDVRDVRFTFDSPGGSLWESLDMGAFIADMPAIVSAQVGGLNTPNAICASACVYAYLAADYRYISNNARIGIHRFGLYDEEMDGNQGAALGQAMSGILSEYIRAHRAEPEFFEAISLIDHDDILWVPKEQLEQWRVVTNNVYDETSEYININGEVALRLKQIAITGDSYLTLLCGEHGLVGVADLHEPALAAYGDFEFAINDEWLPVSQWDVLERKDMRGRIAFEVPRNISQTALQASKIEARVVAPSGDIFFGFQQTLRDRRVAEMIRSCPSTPSRSEPRMVELHSTDFPGADLTSNGIQGISFAECKSICLQHSKCQSVSYVQKRSWCWPKSHVTQRRAAPGIISAYRN
jgi:hypothetical protein